MSTGKLPIVGTSVQYLVGEMQSLRITILPITLSHIDRLQRIERIHNDPFDRIIIAQALEEQLPVVTADKIFAGYGVTALW